MRSKPGPVCIDVLDTLCSGSPFQSYLISEICIDTGRSSNSVFHALQRLKKRGLVGRRKSQAQLDKRCYRWYSTGTGKAFNRAEQARRVEARDSLLRSIKVFTFP